MLRRETGSPPPSSRPVRSWGSLVGTHSVAVVVLAWSPDRQGARASLQEEVRAEAGHLNAWARGMGVNEKVKAPEKLHW